jgi:integrase
MGVFTRPDSPWFWLYLEPTRQKVKTDFRCDALTPQQRKDAKTQAERQYFDLVGKASTDKHGFSPKPSIRFVAFRRWYEQHRTATKRSRVRERSMLRQLAETFDDDYLHAITKERIVRWMSDRAKQVSASTVNRELDVLKDVLMAAVPQYLAESPARGLKRLREVGFEPQILSLEDEAKLYQHAAPEDAALIMAALDTLGRLSELAALKWSHVRQRDLTFVDPKNGKPRKVPISTRLRAALDTLPRSGPFVFSKHHVKKHHYGATAAKRRGITAPPANTGQRPAENSIARMFADACTKAGVNRGRANDGITFHGLRGTGATRMLAAGVDIRTVQMIGGWSDLRSVMRYLRPGTDAHAAVETIAHSRPVPDFYKKAGNAEQISE